MAASNSEGYLIIYFPEYMNRPAESRKKQPAKQINITETVNKRKRRGDGNKKLLLATSTTLT